MTRKPITSTSVVPVCDRKDGDIYLKKGRQGKNHLFSKYLTPCSIALPPSPALIPSAERHRSFSAYPRRAKPLSLSIGNTDSSGWGHSLLSTAVSADTAGADVYDGEKPVSVVVPALCVQDQRSWSPGMYLQKFLHHFRLLSDLQNPPQQ